jgi:hypothetical protein
MIIKSLGRKASAKMVNGQGRSPFSNLVQYMTREDAGEKSQSVLWHGFYGHAGMSERDIASAFEENARLLKERKNGNVLYHEILSFSAGYRLQGEALIRAVSDVGQEYLRHRAPNQMAFGAIHLDTDHIHLHLMISANEVGKRERVRLAKADFAEIQKVIETFTLARYGELAQTRVYDRDRPRERLKTEVHEQAMKARTGAPSQKETIKGKLHGLFERATSMAELERLLQAEGLTLYTRGKSRGVVERLSDGTQRRHRLSTLGLSDHYQATEVRLKAQEPGKSRESSNQTSKEKDMGNETKFGGPGGTVWGVPPDTTPEIVIEELVTGKLHPDWHGQPGETKEPPRAYTDDILKKLQERDQQKTSTRSKDDDQER